MFKALYDLVEHDLPCGLKLSKFNTIMMFFLEVYLNLHFDDIAFRFNVNKEMLALTNLCPSVVLKKLVIRNVY